VPRSAMLRAVTAHLPGVTHIRTWHFEGDIAGILELSPITRRRVYKQLREIDLDELRAHEDGGQHDAQLQTLRFRNASLLHPFAIASLRGLTALDLSHTKVDRQYRDFQWLASRARLQSLILDRTGLADLAFLQRLTQLHTLSIAGASVASLEGLTAVAPTLTSLNISSVYLDIERVDLSPLTNLRVLRADLLAAMNPLDVELNAPLLRSCSFRYCWLQDLAFLSQCLQLVELDLRDIVLFDRTPAPTASPHVTTLHVSCNPVALRSFDWTLMPRLETLQLWKWDAAFVDTERIDASFLSALPRLRSLEITRLSNFRALPSTLPHIRSLRVHQLTTDNVPALLQLLATNEQLGRLSLSADQSMEIELPRLPAPAVLRELQLLNVVVTSLDTLALCTGLRSLKMSGWKTIRCADALNRFLPQCARLQSLTICDNAAFNDVSPLVVLRELQVLSVHHTSVRSISSLAMMRSLLELDLANTLVDRVEPLQGLARLQRIVLPGAVDCGLFHDANAFPMLRSVAHDNGNACLRSGHCAILAA
jgi:hypothetical protein